MQNPLSAAVAIYNGALKLLAVDSTGALVTNTGGTSSALNQTVAAVIKATPGRLCRITIIAPGSTGGAFTFNDCATTGAATTANEVFTMAYNATQNVAGASFIIDWPCQTGIVLSAVPTGGSPIVAVSYT